MKTTNNTMLITGGTSGLGLGLAQRFHALGNTVIIAGRRADLLDETVAAHRGMESVVLDVSDPESIASAYKSVTAAHPELNVLINMAGIMLPENLLDGSALPVAEDTITTNLLGPIRMLNAFVPFLVGRDDAVVMNVSSGLAFVPLPSHPRTTRRRQPSTRTRRACACSWPTPGSRCSSWSRRRSRRHC
ncbi:hypothetical protein AFL01nite_28280 [Aeromicrobium flavum]|uniref:Oxidoreductase n=1 Tax=Aeromicrobium flavum TaxID=416568 RepID=A0A512HYH2_9ACTN|nr:SDR family NAD(P)-dependent oxidoreductase [Aeromicrobium flavum]GEO90501.1 hypothetical protein AFL01nite_28280 [Aeromicrobium flavum]